MIGTSFACCLLDLLSKKEVKAKKASYFPHRLTKRITVRRAENPGLFGGLLKGRPQIAKLLSLVCLLPAVCLLLPKKWPSGAEKSRGARFAHALLLGGALGNGIDRVKNGFVTDFLHVNVPILRRLIFNIADVCIFLGVLLTALFRRRS